MSTAYYLYYAGNGKEELERNLEHKELIGVLTCQGPGTGLPRNTQVFALAMHPGKIAREACFHSQRLWVIDEYGNSVMLPEFCMKVLEHCSIVSYDWRNIPD